MQTLSRMHHHERHPSADSDTLLLTSESEQPCELQHACTHQQWQQMPALGGGKIIMTGATSVPAQISIKGLQLWSWDPKLGISHAHTCKAKIYPQWGAVACQYPSPDL